MAVMAREMWTDERLDDLNKKVDDGFGEMREEFRAVRAEIGKQSRAVRAEMKEELGGIRGEIGAMREELGALNRTVIQLAFAMVGAVLLGFTGTIAALITLV